MFNNQQFIQNDISPQRKKELWNLFIQLNKLQIAWKWVQWNVKSKNNNTLTSQNDSKYAKVLMTNAHA